MCRTNTLIDPYAPQRPGIAAASEDPDMLAYHAAHAAWVEGGNVGPAPANPNLAAKDARIAEMKTFRADGSQARVDQLNARRMAIPSFFAGTADPRSGVPYAHQPTQFGRVKPTDSYDKASLGIGGGSTSRVGARSLMSARAGTRSRTPITRI